MLLRKPSKEEPEDPSKWTTITPPLPEIQYLSYANEDCYYYYKGMS